MNAECASFGDQSKLGNDEFGESVGPKLDYTTYTIVVEAQIRDQINDETIRIKTVVPSKIGFEKGDTMFVMFSDVQGELMPYSGPHGFFKISEGEALDVKKY